jgi:hypothetical protein
VGNINCLATDQPLARLLHRTKQTAYTDAMPERLQQTQNSSRLRWLAGLVLGVAAGIGAGWMLIG